MELKEYMAPEMEVLLLKMESMICLSGDGDEEEEEAPGDMGGGHHL